MWPSTFIANMTRQKIVKPKRIVNVTTAGSVPTSLYLHRQRKRINLPPNMCFDPSDESIKAIEVILGDGSVEVQ